MSAYLDNLKTQIVTPQALDIFNAAMQELIRAAVEESEPDLALAFAQIRFDANQKFNRGNRQGD